MAARGGENTVVEEVPVEGDLNLDQWWDMRIMRCCDCTSNPSCGSVAEIESHLDLVCLPGHQSLQACVV